TGLHNRELRERARAPSPCPPVVLIVHLVSLWSRTKHRPTAGAQLEDGAYAFAECFPQVSVRGLRRLLYDGEEIIRPSANRHRTIDLAQLGSGPVVLDQFVRVSSGIEDCARPRERSQPRTEQAALALVSTFRKRGERANIGERVIPREHVERESTRSSCRVDYTTEEQRIRR